MSVIAGCFAPERVQLLTNRFKVLHRELAVIAQSLKLPGDEVMRLHGRSVLERGECRRFLCRGRKVFGLQHGLLIVVKPVLEVGVKLAFYLRGQTVLRSRVFLMRDVAVLQRGAQRRVAGGGRI